MNDIPELGGLYNICIVCEGEEEYEYLNKILSLDVWLDVYNIETYCAYGNGNIPAVYQERYQSGIYDIVLVFMDTDREPYEQYMKIKDKINDFRNDVEIADKITIFGNPCTMQIIICHWEFIRLKSHNKKKNAPCIEQYTGIVGYKAKTEQREQLFSLITKENFYKCMENIQKLSINEKEKWSTNFYKYHNRFSSDDFKWLFK